MDHYRLYTIDELDEIDSSYQNAHGGSLSGAASESSSIFLEGSSSGVLSTSSSMDEDEWLEDGYHALLSQQLKPLRSLSNAHMPPPHDVGDDFDDEENGGDGLDGEDPYLAINFHESISDTITNTSNLPPPVPNDAERSLRDFQSEDKSRVQNDGDYGGDPGDYVIIDGEEDEEDEQLTDSCLNLIGHLDYVMFPTVEVLEFVRGGELEVEDVNTDRNEIS
ncbi:hypothetical protein V8C37DRAFT_401649 [Trichoderma ceciliae]